VGTASAAGLATEKPPVGAIPDSATTAPVASHTVDERPASLEPLRATCRAGRGGRAQLAAAADHCCSNGPKSTQFSGATGVPPRKSCEQTV